MTLRFRNPAPQGGVDGGPRRLGEGRAGMHVGWLRRALLPGLGALAALAAPVACAESGAAPNPAEYEREREEAGAPLPEAGTVDAGPPVEDASPLDTCSPGGFCPAPMSAVFPLFAVTAQGADAWAVGSGGIVRWNGTSWTLVHPMSIDPSWAHDGIWMTKTDGLWVATTRKIVRYAKYGSAVPEFREFTNGFEVVASWADPASNVLWEVASQYNTNGGRPGVYRFHDDGGGGLSTEDMSIPIWRAEGGAYRWKSIWGFGPNDVYVGGEMCPLNSCDWWSADALRGAIAHWDGTTWSIAILDAKQPVHAMFGTTGLAEPRRLWLGIGSLAGQNISVTSIRLVPVSSDGSVGDAIVSKDVLMNPSDSSMNAPCTHVVGSVHSSNAAWISNGCLVYYWDGAKLDVVRTAINGVPIGRVNGLWAGAAGHAWIAGEALERGVGFVAQRKAGGTP
jgi:hypothetical protein